LRANSDLFVSKGSESRHPGGIGSLYIKIRVFGIHQKDACIWSDKIRFSSSLALHPQNPLIYLLRLLRLLILSLHLRQPVHLRL